MKSQVQSLEELCSALSTIDIEWQDDMSRLVISRLEAFQEQENYGKVEIAKILDSDFDSGILMIRIFLGQSKDIFEAELHGLLGKGGIGKTRYRLEKDAYLNALEDLGLARAMSAIVNRAPRWSDVLVERLRSGRGSAVAGQKRGRQIEDFVEAVVREVFGENYEMRCSFTGQRSQTAKCDIAIPSRAAPRILIEAKGYGATGSKMTDVIGDIEKIISAKRGDTTFLFFTDGATWLRRKSDLKKIVEFQNQGDILRIYTLKMAENFREDLIELKREHNI